MKLKWCKISMRARDWCFLSQPKKCSIILSIQRGQIHGVNFVTLLSYVSTQLNKVAGMFTYLISILTIADFCCFSVQNSDHIIVRFGVNSDKLCTNID